MPAWVGDGGPVDNVDNSVRKASYNGLRGPEFS